MTPEDPILLSDEIAQYTIYEDYVPEITVAALHALAINRMAKALESLNETLVSVIDDTGSIRIRGSGNSFRS